MLFSHFQSSTFVITRLTTGALFVVAIFLSIDSNRKTDSSAMICGQFRTPLRALIQRGQLQLIELSAYMSIVYFLAGFVDDGICHCFTGLFI